MEERALQLHEEDDGKAETCELQTKWLLYRREAASRLATNSSKVLLPLLKSKMLPILRDAAGSCPDQQSKLGSGAFLHCLSSKKEDLVLGPLVVKKLPPLLKGGGSSLTWGWLYCWKRRDLMKWNIASAHRKNEMEIHGRCAPVCFSCSRTVHVVKGVKLKTQVGLVPFFPCSAFASAEESRWVAERLQRGFCMAHLLPGPEVAGERSPCDDDTGEHSPEWLSSFMWSCFLCLVKPNLWLL